MKKAILLLALFLATGPIGASQEVEEIEKSPPLRVEREVKRLPAEGEALWLEIRIGSLPEGAVLKISDGEREALGVISPHDEDVADEQKGKHLLPLPESMASEDRIVILVHLRGPNGKLRKPTAEEVERVRLTYVPVE